MARAAMDRGDLVSAKRMMDDVKRLEVPENAYGPNETRPWMLSLELERQLTRRGGGGVAQAGFTETSAWRTLKEIPSIRFLARILRSVKRPFAATWRPRVSNLCRQNLAWRSCSGQPVAPGRQPMPIVGGGGLKGKQLFDQGMAALQKQDRANAIKLFREAWKYELNSISKLAFN